MTGELIDSLWLRCFNPIQVMIGSQVDGLIDWCESGQRAAWKRIFGENFKLGSRSHDRGEPGFIGDVQLAGSKDPRC